MSADRLLTRKRQRPSPEVDAERKRITACLDWLVDEWMDRHDEAQTADVKRACGATASHLAYLAEAVREGHDVEQLKERVATGATTRTASN
ncbi:hypothetical protein [Gemmata sp.]|uniref:hypothetical protein n=1 Tax=Gemmata sp. TaxID=1914242 RepID=UPI003F6EBC88